MAKISVPVESLTRGFIPNYPRTIFVSEFMLSHWNTLNLAKDQGSEILATAFTGCLDAVIDWSKTDFIKTSDDLTPSDRKRLFMWQKVQTDSSEFKAWFNCPHCKTPDGQPTILEMTYDIARFTEHFIMKPPATADTIEVEYGKKTVVLHLRPFTNRGVQHHNNLLREFLERDVSTEELQIVDLESGDEPLLGAPAKKIACSEYSRHLLTILPLVSSIDGAPELLADIGALVHFVYTYMTKKHVKHIDSYVNDIYHGFEGRETLVCQSCGFTAEEDIPDSLGFFLGSN